MQAGLNGLLVDRDPESIALAIARVLSDAKLAKSTGEHAREYVQRNWNVEGRVDRLEENLLRVVGARRKAACFAH